jgi:pyridinium-3,5-bisthiocarboxylic acid mononucleotide nickel chelatase
MILYLDCIGGIAGDMLMAALIDAGASVDTINSELQKLRIPNLAVATKRTTKHEIDCCHVRVTWGEGQSELSEHSHAKAQPGNRNESSYHLSDHTNHHEGSDNHEGSDDEHPHRPYSAIRDLLGSAGFSPAVTARAQAVFRKLAEAEGSVHGIAADDVHFHEVGSEDAIADVVGAALALEQLGVEEIVVSPLPIGRGFVRSAHGVLPLPAPATLELLRGIPVEGVDIDRELVTPTGAAIVAALGTEFGRFPSMTTTAIGYGAGTRDLAARPNVVRAVLGIRTPTAPITNTFGDAETKSIGNLGLGLGAAANVDNSSTAFDTGIHTAIDTAMGADPGVAKKYVVVIETNLDDCSPELIPDAALAATKAGALDVWVTPATMKKGRPGFVLHALARPDCQAAVAGAILRETSALGVRISHHERIELDRSFFSVEIEGQPINIKIGSQNGAVVNVAPEHDDCAAAAAKLSLPVKEVFARALTSASAHLRSPETQP